MVFSLGRLITAVQNAVSENLNDWSATSPFPFNLIRGR